MRDPYHTLGVDRNASAEDIKRAYRKLAAQHHPDRGGNTARFQEIQQAYDAVTNPQPQPHQPPPGAHPFGGQGFGFGFQFDDFFNMFAQQAQQRRNHVKLSLWVDLRDVAQGARRTVSIGTHMGVGAADIDIPPGINDGDHVQYQGLGPGGVDLVVEFRIKKDSVWDRQDLNLMADRHVVIWDLLCGAQISITDIYDQKLDAQIPAMTQPGTCLRLRGRGLRDRSGNQGDALIRLHALLPDHVAPEILDSIAQFRNK
jgi:DnaJ-class molecular chaperone